MNGRVLVLNASYENHQVVSVHHAIKMLVREVAVLQEAHEGRSLGPFPFPKIIRLVKYVYVKVRKDPRYSRSNILRRDNHLCAYCSGKATTIDHIVPSSKGGKSNWLNVVSACRKCNERKGARTPEQAGMKLMFKPYIPSFYQLMK